MVLALLALNTLHALRMPGILQVNTQASFQVSIKVSLQEALGLHR